MPESKLLPLNQIRFPPNCVICLASAGSKSYPIQQIFNYGRRSHTVTVDIPMCDRHYASASFISPAEKATGCLGIGIGILAGICSAVLLYMRWQGDAGLVLKIFLGALFGFGTFALVWWLIAVLIAPHLATPESKRARHAVRITRYLPGEHLVQLDFGNEQMALLVDRANGST